MNNCVHNKVVVLGGCLAALLAVEAALGADTVLVLKSRDAAQYNEATDAFVARWQASHADDAVVQRTLGGTADNAPLPGTPTNRLAAVVAVGTEATRWAITNSTVPVVFCMVANAQQSVMADLTPASAARVRGVSLDIPALTQLRRMMSVLPKVKRVGVLYDPKKSAAVVREMKQAATELGLEVVDREVDDQSSLPEETALIASRIDLLWAPVDSTVFNSRSAQFVLTEMLQRKVPVMGFSENMVKAGALLAPRVSYEAIGRQTAELLRAVLNPGEPLREPVQAPQDFQIVVNGRVLALLGNPIPQAAIGEVSIIHNEE